MNDKRKHSHLSEKVLKLRMNIPDKEIMEKLNLTKSELNSCICSAYTIERFKHLRKETRRRDAWSTEEYRYLFSWAGIKNRKEINAYLKRGKTERVIKEKLQILGVSSKNLNGLTLTQFKNLFNKQPEIFIQTNAGPPSKFRGGTAHFRIVPWFYIEELMDNGLISHSKAIHIYVKTMSLFQKWIHGEKLKDNFQWKTIP